MTITILAKSEGSKGKLFEQMILTLLEELGYDSLKTNILKSGSEIDIEGKDKITRKPFFCECKATKRKVDMPTFHQFIGKFMTEKSKNKDIVGIFFTLSPLTPAALENYTELVNTILKGQIILHEWRSILKLLEASKLIVSENFVDSKVKNMGYDSKDRYLIYTKGGFYWVQLFKKDEKTVYFTAFDCYGNLIPKSVIEEIKELDTDLSDKKYIGEIVHKEIPKRADLEENLAKEFGKLKEDLFIKLDNRYAKFLKISDFEVAEEEMIEKHEVLRNPFHLILAETITDEQVSRLFVKPPGFDMIEQKSNTVIEGNKGTGRSMLLRYLSVETQIEKIRGKNKDSYDLPFLGVYIKSYPAWSTAGRKESDISVMSHKP